MKKLPLKTQRQFNNANFYDKSTLLTNEWIANNKNPSYKKKRKENQMQIYDITTDY